MVSQTSPKDPDQFALEWNSIMLSCHYEIINLPKNVQRYYGCGQRFVDSYRVFFNNLIVRHKNSRIMEMSIIDQPIVNRDFQYTYFHLKRDRIARKNFTFAINPVIFAKTDACQLFTEDPVSRSMLNKNQTFLSS